MTLNSVLAVEDSAHPYIPTGGEREHTKQEGRASWIDKRSRRTGDFLKYVIMTPGRRGGQLPFRFAVVKECNVRPRPQGDVDFGPSGSLCLGSQTMSIFAEYRMPPPSNKTGLDTQNMG